MTDILDLGPLPNQLIQAALETTNNVIDIVVNIINNPPPVLQIVQDTLQGLQPLIDFTVDTTFFYAQLALDLAQQLSDQYVPIVIALVLAAPGIVLEIAGNAIVIAGQVADQTLVIINNLRENTINPLAAELLFRAGEAARNAQDLINAELAKTPERLENAQRILNETLFTVGQQVEAARILALQLADTAEDIANNTVNSVLTAYNTLKNNTIDPAVANALQRAADALAFAQDEARRYQAFLLQVVAETPGAATRIVNETLVTVDGYRAFAVNEINKAQAQIDSIKRNTIDPQVTMVMNLATKTLADAQTTINGAPALITGIVNQQLQNFYRTKAEVEAAADRESKAAIATALFYVGVVETAVNNAINSVLTAYNTLKNNTIDPAVANAQNQVNATVAFALATAAALRKQAEDAAAAAPGQVMKLADDTQRAVNAEVAKAQIAIDNIKRNTVDPEVAKVQAEVARQQKFILDTVASLPGTIANLQATIIKTANDTIATGTALAGFVVTTALNTATFVEATARAAKASQVDPVTVGAVRTLGQQIAGAQVLAGQAIVIGQQLIADNGILEINDLQTTVDAVNTRVLELNNTLSGIRAELFNTLGQRRSDTVDPAVSELQRQLNAAILTAQNQLALLPGQVGTIVNSGVQQATAASVIATNAANQQLDNLDVYTLNVTKLVQDTQALAGAYAATAGVIAGSTLAGLQTTLGNLKGGTIDPITTNAISQLSQMGERLNQGLQENIATAKREADILTITAPGQLLGIAGTAAVLVEQQRQFLTNQLNSILTITVGPEVTKAVAEANRVIATIMTVVNGLPGTVAFAQAAALSTAALAQSEINKQTPVAVALVNSIGLIATNTATFALATIQALKTSTGDPAITNAFNAAISASVIAQQEAGKAVVFAQGVANGLPGLGAITIADLSGKATQIANEQSANLNRIRAELDVAVANLRRDTVDPGTITVINIISGLATTIQNAANNAPNEVQLALARASSAAQTARDAATAAANQQAANAGKLAADAIALENTLVVIATGYINFVAATSAGTASQVQTLLLGLKVGTVDPATKQVLDAVNEQIQKFDTGVANIVAAIKREADIAVITVPDAVTKTAADAVRTANTTIASTQVTINNLKDNTADPVIADRLRDLNGLVAEVVKASGELPALIDSTVAAFQDTVSDLLVELGESVSVSGDLAVMVVGTATSTAAFVQNLLSGVVTEQLTPQVNQRIKEATDLVGLLGQEADDLVLLAGQMIAEAPSDIDDISLDLVNEVSARVAVIRGNLIAALAEAEQTIGEIRDDFGTPAVIDVTQLLMTAVAEAQRIAGTLPGTASATIAAATVIANSTIATAQNAANQQLDNLPELTIEAFKTVKTVQDMANAYALLIGNAVSAGVAGVIAISEQVRRDVGPLSQQIEDELDEQAAFLGQEAAELRQTAGEVIAETIAVTPGTLVTLIDAQVAAAQARVNQALADIGDLQTGPINALVAQILVEIGEIEDSYEITINELPAVVEFYRAVIVKAGNDAVITAGQQADLSLARVQQLSAELRFRVEQAAIMAGGLIEESVTPQVIEAVEDTREGLDQIEVEVGKLVAQIQFLIQGSPKEILDRLPSINATVDKAIDDARAAGSALNTTLQKAVSDALRDGLDPISLQILDTLDKLTKILVDFINALPGQVTVIIGNAIQSAQQAVAELEDTVEEGTPTPGEITIEIDAIIRFATGLVRDHIDITIFGVQEAIDKVREAVEDQLPPLEGGIKEIASNLVQDINNRTAEVREYIDEQAPIVSETLLAAVNYARSELNDLLLQILAAYNDAELLIQEIQDQNLEPRLNQLIADVGDQINALEVAIENLPNVIQFVVDTATAGADAVVKELGNQMDLNTALIKMIQAEVDRQVAAGKLLVDSLRREYFDIVIIDIIELAGKTYMEVENTFRVVMKTVQDELDSRPGKVTDALRGTIAEIEDALANLPGTIDKEVAALRQQVKDFIELTIDPTLLDVGKLIALVIKTVSDLIASLPGVIAPVLDEAKRLLDDSDELVNDALDVVVQLLGVLVPIIFDGVEQTRLLFERMKAEVIDPAAADAIKLAGDALVIATQLVDEYSKKVLDLVADPGELLDPVQDAVNELVEGTYEAVEAAREKAVEALEKLEEETVRPVIAGAIEELGRVLDLVGAAVEDAPRRINEALDTAFAVARAAQEEAERQLDEGLETADEVKSLAEQRAAEAVAFALDTAAFYIAALMQQLEKVRGIVDDAFEKYVSPVIDPLRERIDEVTGLAQGVVAMAIAQVVGAAGQAEAAIRELLRQIDEAIDGAIGPERDAVEALVASLVKRINDEVQALMETAAAAMEMVGAQRDALVTVVMNTLGTVQGLTFNRPLFYGELTTPIVVTSKDEVVTIAPGGLIIRAE